MKQTKQNKTQTKDKKQNAKLKRRLEVMKHLLNERFNIPDVQIEERNSRLFISQSIFGETELLFCLSLCFQYKCEMLVSNCTSRQHKTEVMFYGFKVVN